MIPWLAGIDGILLLPILAIGLLFAPGIVRDAVSHLTRKDLPE